MSTLLGHSVAQALQLKHKSKTCFNSLEKYYNKYKPKELLNKEPNNYENEELSRIEQEKELQQIRSLIEKSRASPLNIIKKKRSP